MTTGLSLIQDALMEGGVLAPGQAIEAGIADYVKRRLNAMLSAWSIDGLMIYTIKRSVYALTIGKGSYTLGPGGDINASPPSRIENAKIIQSSNAGIEIPIDILDAEEWADMAMKGISGGVPVCVYPDNGAPFNTLSFWMTPTEACSVVLYTWEILGTITDLSTELNFPPGYEEMIVYNLITRLSALCNITPGILRMAQASRINIEASNVHSSPLTPDTPFAGGASLGRLTNGFVK